MDTKPAVDKLRRQAADKREELREERRRQEETRMPELKERERRPKSKTGTFQSSQRDSSSNRNEPWPARGDK